jgi:membrane protease YdiL (CAAX protease family)
MEEESDYTSEIINCDECNVEVIETQRYCYNCGAYLGAQAVTINVFNNKDLRRIFIFYFTYLFICLFVKHTSYFRSYDQLFWVEVALAAVTLRFAWLNRHEMKPVLRFNNFRWWRAALLMILAVGFSCLVSYTVREVNVTFFHRDVSYFNGYKLYYFPILLMIYSVALNPAVFEEMAFRGVMYNNCSAFLDERLVVAVTAFLFAIMHLNLLSLIWLIPFGFLLGHLRRRYNTVWYGILFHFAFNLTACFVDLYRQGELLQSATP